jgi:hypothetical protein
VWHSHMCLQCMLIRFPPSFFIILILYKLHLPHLPSFTLSLSLVPTPGYDLLYLSVLHISSVYWLFEGILPWYFTHAYIVL